MDELDGTRPARTDAARVGERIGGRYELRELLGRGGCATVYRALDLERGCEVAVKTLRPELATDADVVRWFQREARILRMLRHPGIVEVLDAATAGEVLFITMELLEGTTLAGLLKEQQTLEPITALTLLRPVLEAMAFAHASHVVHRDLKPSNIFVGRARSADRTGSPWLGDEVKVLDFGLAKLRAIAARSATLSGVAIGTPGYMPPEQIVGDSVVGPEADVWALGTVLYEALSGHLPFEGGSRAERLLRALTRDPTPIREHVPTLPANLAQVIDRSLSNEPSARPPDARALLSALDECREDVSRSGTHVRPHLADRTVLDTCAFERCERTLVIVHSSASPTDAEWDRWLERMARGDWDRLLVWSDGGAPDARQRALTSEFWRGRVTPPMSVITTSKLVRGVVTAFRWLVRANAAAFDPSRAVDAMQFIGVPVQEQARCMAVCQRLRATVRRGDEATTARAR